MHLIPKQLMTDFIKNLRFIWTFSINENRNLIIVIILNIVGIFISVINPILIAQIIIGITSIEIYKIIYVAIFLLINETIYNGFHNYSKIILNKISFNILANMEIEISKILLKLENKVMDKNGSGIFLQRLTVDATRLIEIFNNILKNIPLLLKNIGILVAILLINKIVFLFLIVGLIIKYLLEYRRNKIRNIDDITTRKSYEKISGFLIELVYSTKDMKMLNSAENLIRTFKPIIKNYTQNKINLESESRKNRTISDEVSTVLDFILIVLLVYLIMKKDLTPTLALVLFNYSNNLGRITGIFGDLLEYIQDFNLSSERVRELFNNNMFKQEEFGTKHLKTIQGNIEFKNVEFSYDKNTILKDLSFKINSNENVAIVGKSGTGKTTIFNLISRLYDINKGEILLDGININELDKDSIRNNISILSQNPYIFNLSIKDNLKLIKPDLTEDEMIEVCELAFLNDLINQLPDKYDTILGENGVKISGGQKQRIALARIFLLKTKIILLDEATSTLDNNTQKQIQKSIDNLKKNHTIIMIAHRLSTIINCDRILFLENGKIIAEGSHQELLENCPSYKKLYETEIFKD